MTRTIPITQARTRVSPMVMPPKPEAQTFNHGMTWAEMAKAEGHRKGLPASARAKTDGARRSAMKRLENRQAKSNTVLKAMHSDTEYMARDLAEVTGFHLSAVSSCLASLKHRGLVQISRKKGNSAVWVRA